MFPKKLFGGGEPGKSLSHTNFLYAFKDNAKWDQPLAGGRWGCTWDWKGPDSSLPLPSFVHNCPIGLKLPETGAQEPLH